MIPKIEDIENSLKRVDWRNAANSRKIIKDN